MPGFHHHDPHQDHHHDHHSAPMHVRGEMVHFAFKQVSLFGNDKHVHVVMWLDGQLLNHAGHGMGELSVQIAPGPHTVGIAVYNPDAMFDAKHPRQPEDTARFDLKEGSRGLLFGLFGGHHDRHVVIEYAVRENLLTKTATADIKRVKVLK